MKLIILFFFFIQFAHCQKINCDDLKDFIETKGYSKEIFYSYSLNSSWLYKVKAYSYDYKIYVIAEIKENEYSYSTKNYVFCGIPQQNWTNFQFKSYGDSGSYGERFHKYIIDYKCNCY